MKKCARDGVTFYWGDHAILSFAGSLFVNGEDIDVRFFAGLRKQDAEQGFSLTREKLDVDSVKHILIGMRFGGHVEKRG